MSVRTSPITAEVIRQAIDGIDGLGSYELRPRYRGRGMREDCVGVVVESWAALLALGASIAYVIVARAEMGEEMDDLDDAIEPLSRAYLDNMGLGYIVYWPGVTTDQPTEETQP